MIFSGTPIKLPKTELNSVASNGGTPSNGSEVSKIQELVAHAPPYMANFQQGPNTFPPVFPPANVAIPPPPLNHVPPPISMNSVGPIRPPLPNISGQPPFHPYQRR